MAAANIEFSNRVVPLVMIDFVSPGTREYDIHIYHFKGDRKWVSKWLQGPLEAKRFNIKMKTIGYENSKK